MADIEGQVRAALLADAPHARFEPARPCAQANIDRDLALLDDVLSCGGPDHLLRIWSNPACVVVSKRLAADISMSATEQALRPLGVQLAVRASGGSAVVHRPGVINVSLARIAPCGLPVGGVYGELTDLLARALRRLCLETCAGAAPGAYCDGAHNLLWQGRKLAGAAAVVRRRNGVTARLVHASLVVSGDIHNDIRLVHVAEQGARSARTYTPAAHTSVAEAVGRRRPS